MGMNDGAMKQLSIRKGIKDGRSTGRCCCGITVWMGIYTSDRFETAVQRKRCAKK